MIKNKKNRPTSKNYIELIASDCQFDKKHEDYLGFLNIDPTEAFESKGDDYRDIAMQIAMNPTQFESAFNIHGLTIELANEAEIIITDNYITL